MQRFITGGHYRKGGTSRMIAEDKQVELLCAQLEAGREFIARQVRARFYLIGATFVLAFVLLLPPGVPPSLLNVIAKEYKVTNFRAPEELISTLIWLAWSTSVLQACSRSVVISREAKYLRVIESRLLPLAGPLVTRYTDFQSQSLPFLRSAEIAYLAAFAGTTLLVGGNRIFWEWGASHWSPAFITADTLLFASTVALLVVAMRDLAKGG
jgi:hypothetical protein